MFPFGGYMHGYDLCSDTVTVYRSEGGAVTRTVHPRAYLDMRKTENVERTGTSEASGFLLVVPGDADIRVEDRVYLGEGPEVTGDAARWWRTFIPAKVDGLVAVRYVDRKRFAGEVVHVEAGG